MEETEKYKIGVVKKYLSQYRYIRPMLRRIERRLRECEARETATTAQYSERISGSLPQSAVEIFVINKEEELKRIIEDQEYWYSKKREIDSVIINDALSTIESLVLMNRYEDSWEWEKIALEQNYSRSGVIWIHNTACVKLYDAYKGEFNYDKKTER